MNILESLPEFLRNLVIMLPAFMLAIILHEVAHGMVALWCGDDTAKLSGRITLSPLPHIDPIGLLMFVLSSIAGFGFGWAKPVPVNPLRFRHPRRDDILVSLAGVTVNFLQALVWAGIYHLARANADGQNIATAIMIFCYYATGVNLVLMVFNLIPIPPLDGSHVLFNLLRLRDPLLMMRLSQIGPMLLLLMLYMKVLNPLFDVTIDPMMGWLLRV